MNLQDLKKAILEDNIIDAEEVKQLESVLYEDGVIDQEEADFLFELNDAVSGNDNHSSWQPFFVKAICDFLLEDETSPGEIDEDETKWLVGKIEGDGQIDDVEKQLLAALKSKAKAFPEELQKLLN
ncbi:TerB family tellurite resistance protein [Puteibacter caeruleilacunae]|nr:TerB family tellurite resistance protein [Puteibacter caeruleilacunae]